VAKGFEQREGYDYGEIFSLVARMETNNEINHCFSCIKAMENSPNGRQVCVSKWPT